MLPSTARAMKSFDIAEIVLIWTPTGIATRTGTVVLGAGIGMPRVPKLLAPQLYNCPSSPRAVMTCWLVATEVRLTSAGMAHRSTTTGVRVVVMVTPLLVTPDPGSVPNT